MKTGVKQLKRGPKVLPIPEMGSWSQKAIAVAFECDPTSVSKWDNS